MIITIEQDGHRLQFNVGECDQQEMLDIIKEQTSFMFTPDWMEIEVVFENMIEPENFFMSHDEAYDYFKSGTKEEIQAAIDRFQQCQWFEVCSKLKELI